MLENYLKNPVVLADHDPSKVVAPQVKDDCLQGVLTFAPKGVSAKADEYCGLYKAEVMKTVSVGFRPVRWTSNADGEGYTYQAWELMELSCVAVPMDPGAIMIARSHRRSLTAIDFDRLSFAEIGKALADPAAILEVRQLVEAQRAGRVLSAESLAHVKGIMKCFGRAMDCRTKALDSHDLTDANLEEFASHIETGVVHAKALMKTGKPKPKPDPGASSSDDPADGSDDPADDDYVDPDDAAGDDAEAARRKRQIQIMGTAPDFSEALVHMSPEQRRAALAELDGFAPASSSSDFLSARQQAEAEAVQRLRSFWGM
jgi:hypothetical protein